MMNDLNKAIIETITYFDVLDFPLTGFELWRYLYDPTRQTVDSGQADVLRAVEVLTVTGAIKEYNGYYTLPGRESLVLERFKRLHTSWRRWKKVLRVFYFCQWVPGLMMVALCNRTATFMATESSDIDVFIITRSRRIWTTRLLVTLVTQLFGQRRHGTKISNRICLSYYINENSQNLEFTALDNNDIHLASWLSQIMPVYAREGIDTKFFVANSWIKKMFVHYGEVENKPRFTVRHSSTQAWLQKLGETIFSGKFGNVVEKFAKWLQQGKMELNKREHTSGAYVMVEDSILKFHEDDRRALYREQFLKRLQSINPVRSAR